MLNDVKKMIQEELPKGETILPDEQLEEACEMSEDMEVLARLCDEHRITPTKELPPMRFLFTFNGTPCMPICELVAGTGKAKSGTSIESDDRFSKNDKVIIYWKKLNVAFLKGSSHIVFVFLLQYGTC